MGGELRRAGVAAAASARRHQHDRALGLARREHARELQQRGGARQLGARARAGRVAMGEDRDRGRVGGTGPQCDHGPQRALAVDRLRAEAALAHGEAAPRSAPQAFQIACHVRRQQAVAAAAGAPVRVFPGKRVHFGKRARAFERVRSQRGGERLRSRGERQGRDRESEGDRQQGRTVQAPAQHLAEDS